MTERQRPLTAGCLFSGMGGLASGLDRAGFGIRWASDNDQFAAATFRHRFPDARFIQKDVRELSAVIDQLAEVDVLAGGFPCQSFSQAGDRLGFEDLRGEVFFEIPRLLKEIEPARRPPLLILENVPYLRYGAGGQWFDAVQRELRLAGYWFRESACWLANVKDYTELPQDRERLFMVAASKEQFTYNPFSPAALKKHTDKTARPLSAFVNRAQRGIDEAYLPEQNRYFKMISRKMESGESLNNIYQLRRSYVREKKNGLCPTLTANMGIGGHNVPFIRDAWGIRKLSVNEVVALQGFDIEPPLFPAGVPEPEQYRLVGNAACVHLARIVGLACAAILRGEAP